MLQKAVVPPPAKEEGRPQPQRPAARAQPATQASLADESSDGEIDEDDLVASSTGIEDGRMPPGASPSLFCSISGRSHQLTRTVRAVAASTAHRLPRVFRRKPLGRQSR